MAHLHKNGKVSPHYSDYGRLKPAPHEKIRFTVIIVDDHIRMSMPEINDEDYFHPVTESEDD